MLNLQICTVIIMTKKKKIIIIIKKFMRFPRFEPGIHGFKVHQNIQYAMEANAINREK